MFKRFSIITFSFLLGTISISKPLQAMHGDPETYGMSDTIQKMYDMFQHAIWGSDYDDGQNGGNDPWAAWEKQGALPRIIHIPSPSGIIPTQPSVVPTLADLSAQELAKANILPENQLTFFRLENPNCYPVTYGVFVLSRPNTERVLVAEKICRTKDFENLTDWQKRACIHKLRNALSKIEIAKEDKEYLFIELTRACKFQGGQVADYMIVDADADMKFFQDLFEKTYSYKTAMQMIKQEVYAFYRARPVFAVIHTVVFIHTIGIFTLNILIREGIF